MDLDNFIYEDAPFYTRPRETWTIEEMNEMFDDGLANSRFLRAAFGWSSKELDVAIGLAMEELGNKGIAVKDLTYLPSFGLQRYQTEISLRRQWPDIFEPSHLRVAEEPWITNDILNWSTINMARKRQYPWRHYSLWQAVLDVAYQKTIANDIAIEIEDKTCDADLVAGEQAQCKGTLKEGARHDVDTPAGKCDGKSVAVDEPYKQTGQQSDKRHTKSDMVSKRRAEEVSPPSNSHKRPRVMRVPLLDCVLLVGQILEHNEKTVTYKRKGLAMRNIYEQIDKEKRWKYVRLALQLDTTCSSLYFFEVGIYKIEDIFDFEYGVQILFERMQTNKLVMFTSPIQSIIENLPPGLRQLETYKPRTTLLDLSELATRHSTGDVLESSNASKSFEQSSAEQIPAPTTALGSKHKSVLAESVPLDLYASETTGKIPHKHASGSRRLQIAESGLYRSHSKDE